MPAITIIFIQLEKRPKSRIWSQHGSMPAARIQDLQRDCSERQASRTCDRLGSIEMAQSYVHILAGTSPGAMASVIAELGPLHNL